MKLIHAHLQDIFLAVSVLLFIICLANDGYYLDGASRLDWAPAWGLLLTGWIGLFVGVVTWLANPCLFVSWYLFHTKRPGLAALCAALALAFMVSFLFHKTIITSARPDYARIAGYGLGYWLWVASASTLLIGSIVIMYLPSGRSNIP